MYKALGHSYAVPLALMVWTESEQVELKQGSWELVPGGTAAPKVTAPWAVNTDEPEWSTRIQAIQWI